MERRLATTFGAVSDKLKGIESSSSWQSARRALDTGHCEGIVWGFSVSGGLKGGQMGNLE
jgi:hypothetical protein